MNTTSVGIANYCVPCRANCRYCLLESCRRADGVDCDRGARFADRIWRELRAAVPEVRCYYYIGYCMDTPKLLDYLRFCRERGFPSARFLQMNGFGFRDQASLNRLMEEIRACGVSLIDLTFYGTRSYHDAFAGREGDFDFLLRMEKAARLARLPVHFSAPLTRENREQADDLLSILCENGPADVSFFLPHSKGRGKALMKERLTRSDYEALSDAVRARFSKTPHRTEGEWLAKGNFEPYQERSLVLVLCPEEMDRLETMTGEAVLRFLEGLDDRYLAEVPTPPELAKKYGDPSNEQLFRLRDLLLTWQQRYIREAGRFIYDMRDETHHFSAHR